MGDVRLEIALFGLAHLGALIFFLGDVKRAVKDHDRRLDCLESSHAKVIIDVAELKGRWEAQAQ